MEILARPLPPRRNHPQPRQAHLPDVFRGVWSVGDHAIGNPPYHARHIRPDGTTQYRDVRVLDGPGVENGCRRVNW